MEEVLKFLIPLAIGGIIVALIYEIKAAKAREANEKAAANAKNQLNKFREKLDSASNQELVDIFNDLYVDKP